MVMIILGYICMLFHVKATTTPSQTSVLLPKSSPTSATPVYCPENCNCTKGKLECIGTDSDEIPKIIGNAPNDIYSLSFQKSQLKTFSLRLLQRFSNLTHLDLSYNLLTSIPRNVSLYAPRLFQLNLAHNRITTLQESQLSGAYLLKELVLSSNYIESINDNIFRNCSHLYGLDLKGNKINNISSSCAFNGLKKLTNLDLSSNNITALPSQSFKYLISLWRIFISDNHLTVIPSSLFKDLTLDNVNFARNNITEIQNSVFADTDIMNFDLSNNHLKTIPLGFIINESFIVETLDLSSNPIICDCQFHQFYESIMSGNEGTLKVSGNCITTGRDIVEIMKTLTCTSSTIIKTTTTTTTTSTKDTLKGLSTGWTVFIVLACVALFIVLLIGVIVFYKKLKRPRMQRLVEWDISLKDD